MTADRFDCFAHDTEPESRPLDAKAGRRVRAKKTLEQMCALAFRNTDPVIGDSDDDLVTAVDRCTRLNLCSDFDPADVFAPISVLDRVREEIRQR